MVEPADLRGFWLLPDEFGLDLEADRLGEQEPTRLQGGVPDQAPVLAVDLEIGRAHV